MDSYKIEQHKPMEIIPLLEEDLLSLQNVSCGLERYFKFGYGNISKDEHSIAQAVTHVKEMLERDSRRSLDTVVPPASIIASLLTAGVANGHVFNVITRAVELGWLEKVGNEGYRTTSVAVYIFYWLDHYNGNLDPLRRYCKLPELNTLDMEDSNKQISNSGLENEDSQTESPTQISSLQDVSLYQVTVRKPYILYDKEYSESELIALCDNLKKILKLWKDMEADDATFVVGGMRLDKETAQTVIDEINKVL